MADLQNLEVMVDVDRNSSRFGDGGGKRMASTAFLLVGGTSQTYTVSMNFESGNAHWCKTESGARCQGNGNGKSRTYGKPPERDKHNPQHWCKHVKAALAATEKLAEAQEITARAFGKGSRVIPITVKAPVPAFGRTQTASERLAALEAEALEIRAEIAAAENAEIREALTALVEKFSLNRIDNALAKLA